MEEEQKGGDRASYGSKVLDSLSQYLTQKYGKGFSRTNIASMRKFYLVYKERDSLIVQSGIAQLPDKKLLQQKLREWVDEVDNKGN